MEKLKLFKDAKVLVYDMDDARVAGCVNRSAFKGEYFAWSRQRRDVPLYIASVEKREAETVVSYIYKGKEAACSIPFYRRGFVGQFRVLPGRMLAFGG